MIAEENDKVVGQTMITFEWSDWRNANIWWIQSVYVDISWRKKGVFKKLFKEIKKMAQKQNVHAFRLYVHDENTEAMKAYEQIGMAKEPYRIYHYPLS